MSFDKPVDITLKITTLNDMKRRRLYVFHTIGCGDNFRVAQIKRYSNCQMFSICNDRIGPLQYSDRVEVLKPQGLRNKIAEKVKVLSEKYNKKL